MCLFFFVFRQKRTCVKNALYCRTNIEQLGIFYSYRILFDCCSATFFVISVQNFKIEMKAYF